MRLIGFTFVLLFLHVGCMSAPKRSIKPYALEPSVISDRVGAIIDADEREYYDLFSALTYIAPMTYRYESATFHAALGEGYAVRVVTTQGTLVSLIHDPRGMAIITDYIDNYEEVMESREAYEEKWDIVAYDMLNLPITKHEIELIKQKLGTESKPSKSSPVYTGAVLGATIGGATALAITAIVYASEVDTIESIFWNDPELQELFNIGRALSMCASGCVGGLVGAGIGAIIGSSVRRSGDAQSYNAEDVAIIDAIKKQRMPIVVK